MAISVDRLQGLSGDLGVKCPVRVATTANIPLSGLQTIDGITVAAGDRVLVKDQTDAADNGIWDAATSSWSRSLDFDGANDAVAGTMVIVSEGTTNGGQIFLVSNIGTITIGTTPLTWANAFLSTFISSIGSSLIGFIQAGVGAVLRSVQDKLRERVSIADFGAVAGGTDNVVYFAAAAAYCVANKCNLHIPAGDWYTSAAFTFTNAADSFSITGDGADVSALIFTGATDGIVVTFADWRDGTCEVRDLGIHTSVTGAAGTALKITSTTYTATGNHKGPLVDNIRIGASFSSNGNTTYWTNGIYFKHMPHATIKNSWINGKPDNTLGTGVQFDTYCIAGTIFEGLIYNFNKGVYVNGYQTEGIHIGDTRVISCYDGIYADSSATGVETALSITSSSIDVDHYGVYLNTRDNTLIDGCDFYAQDRFNTPGHADIYAAAANSYLMVSNCSFRREVGTELSTGIDLVDCAVYSIVGNWMRTRDTGIRISSISTRPTIYGNDLDGCAVEIEDNTLTANKDIRVIAHKKAACSAHTLLNLTNLPTPVSIPDTTLTAVTTFTDTQDHGGGTFDSVGTKKITVATGVSKVLPRAQVCFDANATGYRRATILKNGAVYVGCADVEVPAAAAGVTSLNITGAPTTVVAGDYFEVWVEQTSGAPLGLTAASRTWFSLEVLA